VTTERSGLAAGRRSGRPPLTLFDATNLVVGAVVGADIYIVTGQGAQLLGPAVLVAWVAAGAMALAIALAFGQCALAVPRTGGSYAYARAAFGPFPAFVVGWCFYVGELVGAAVFPIAFTRYLADLIPGLVGTWEMLARAAFVAFITVSNYVGVRAAGTVNDVLTMAKLLPLAALVLLGIPWAFAHPTLAVDRVSPFVPLGWGGFGAALTLVFWAYAGFEVAPLPAGEIRRPGQTLPLALWWGMLVSTALYLLVNAVALVVLPWTELARSPTPLVAVAGALFRDLGLPGRAAATFMVVGAMLSIGGVDEAITIGTPSLAYRLATDGYLPRLLARRSRRFGTPSAAIFLQGAATLALSFLSSLVGLISLSVFYLGLVYLATALASWRLGSARPLRPLAVPLPALVAPVAVASSLALIAASVPEAGVGAALGLAAGLPFYLLAARSPSLHRLEEPPVHEEERWREIRRVSRHFLAGLLRHLARPSRPASP